MTARYLPQSLAARTVTALVLGFVLLSAAMVGVHDFLLRQALDRGTEELLSQRLATLVDTLGAVPRGVREEVSRSLSKQGFVVIRASDPAAETQAAPLIGLEGMLERTRALTASARKLDVLSGRFDPGNGHLVGVQARAELADGSWLEIEISAPDLLIPEVRVLYAAAATMGLALLAAVGFAAWSVAAPLSRLASTVTLLDPAGDGPVLSEDGPREVRQLARALNGMAARMRDVLRQRTIALGALSHDLMSPIARMRLRTEDAPPSIREPLRRDLTEMETMVADVLAYLRGAHGDEPTRTVSVAALVSTVAAEFTDAGTPVEERQMDEEAIAGIRKVAIKRAVTNLIGNATIHGVRPWVEVLQEESEVVVRIGDHGPGIPPEDLPRVTEPFFRGDRARSTGGGSGLGLATARTITEAHGGSLGIASTPGGGTVVTLRLPRHATMS